MGLAKCPFDQTSFDVKDGRKTALRNSGFGTVFAVADDRPLPVCDYAGRGGMLCPKLLHVWHGRTDRFEPSTRAPRIDDRFIK